MGLIEAVMAVVVSLTGSHWVSSENSKQSVEFNASQITGYGGCNRFFGTYSQTESKIAVGQLASTRVGCSYKVMLKERDFLVMLESAKNVEVEDNVLILKNAGGEVLAKFNRKNVG